MLTATAKVGNEMLYNLYLSPLALALALVFPTELLSIGAGSAP